jgi:Fe-S cluster assembly ATPase SufC
MQLLCSSCFLYAECRFKQEKCIVVFTHSEAIMAIADCVHLIDNGQVVVSGSYADLVGSCKADTELAISAALSAVSTDCASAKTSTN